MPAANFTDKVVLITGASSGIGQALAEAFAKQGARLALVARNTEKLHELESQFTARSIKCLSIPANVRDRAAVTAAVATVQRHFNRLDILVNNAGIGQASTVEDTSLDEFRDVFETNFFGPLHFMQAAIPVMTEQGSGLIIQISSLNGFCAIPLGSAYCASKFALEAMSESARYELHRHNIRVLVVRPGVTDTSFFDNARHFREKNPFPLDRMMSAETVARKILRAAAGNRRELALTAEGKLLWWMKKIAPHLVDRILAGYVKARPATTTGSAVS